MSTRVNHYIDTMYGGMPSEPTDVQAVLVHRLPCDWGVLQIWRVGVTTSNAKLSWMLRMYWPSQATEDPAHILLSPDGCWPHCLSIEAVKEIMARGMVAASVDRLDVAHDPPGGERAGLLIESMPLLSFGALSAWAWVVGQTVRAMAQSFPSSLTAVMGHSRGGKAALLAAAYYPQIAAVISHNSGTAGASSMQIMDEGAESLQALVMAFPHWLGPLVGQESVQAQLIADDGRELLKGIAPRGLMMIQAQDDLWANPRGARHRYEQLKGDWTERPNALALHERSGGHAIGAKDWAVAADFLLQLQPALRQ